MTSTKATLGRSVRSFSMLAGPLQKYSKKTGSSIELRAINTADGGIFKAWVLFLAYGASIITILAGVTLFWPDNWVLLRYNFGRNAGWDIAMLASLLTLQLFFISRTFASTLSTLNARNPVPLTPVKGLRVAFVTTRAPGEPIWLVKKTLRAARKITYKQGSVHVWLLDETDDARLRSACRQLGVRYFTRKGIERWNSSRKQRKSYDPRYEAKTKHGNYNAWLAYVRESGLEYDIMAGVDTDQVPLNNYLTRLLGYFHDDDVAFVVGPQVYGNYRKGLLGLVVRWAESQASFFQSTIQRAGNRSGSAMFVGTNYAIRMSTLRQVDGFTPCITEDMATSLSVHAAINPITGKRWRSIYTPDVLAIGEGPDRWGSYFSQQWRWAAGTFDAWRKLVWKTVPRLPAGARLHYLLMLTFYPTAALAWLIAIGSSLIYLITGATALDAPWQEFVSLYSIALIMQLSLYFWNRRYNVSPHEPAGSYGIAGMLLTSIAAPIYFSAFISVAVGRRVKFVVTKKGTKKQGDTIHSFRSQIPWLIICIAGGVYGYLHQHFHPAMLVWTFVLVMTCAAPIIFSIATGARRTVPEIRRAGASAMKGDESHVQI